MIKGYAGYSKFQKTNANNKQEFIGEKTITFYT